MLGSPPMAIPAAVAFVLLVLVSAAVARERTAIVRMWPELTSTVVCLALVAVIVPGGGELDRLSVVAAGLLALVWARMHRISAFSLASVLVPVALVLLGALSVPVCLWVMGAYCALRILLRAGQPLAVTHA